MSLLYHRHGHLVSNKKYKGCSLSVSHDLSIIPRRTNNSIWILFANKVFVWIFLSTISRRRNNCMWIFVAIYDIFNLLQYHPEEQTTLWDIFMQVFSKSTTWICTSFHSGLVEVLQKNKDSLFKNPSCNMWVKYRAEI